MQPNSSISSPGEPHAHARFGSLIGAVFRKWRREVTQDFKAMGLTDATCAPLLALVEWPVQAVRQKDLAERLSLEKSSLVRILTQLRDMGLVEWATAEDDRRAKSIRLTLQGRRLAERIVAKSMEIEARILEGLTAEELQTTREVLGKIVRRFEVQE